MFYPYPDWENDPGRCIYLGSEMNPRTRFKYDYWLIRTGIDDHQWSPTARHGLEGPDYSSCPMSVCWYDYTHIDGTEDYLFGTARARQLGMYYLATGKKPLLEDAYIVQRTQLDSDRPLPGYHMGRDVFESGVEMHPRLQAIYDLFKPMAETITWASAEDNRGKPKNVCVHFANINGHMRWWMEGDELKFEYVRTD